MRFAEGAKEKYMITCQAECNDREKQYTNGSDLKDTNVLQMDGSNGRDDAKNNVVKTDGSDCT